MKMAQRADEILYGMRTSDATPARRNGPRPMELGEVRNVSSSEELNAVQATHASAGTGQGFTGQCHYCRRPGHKRADCRKRIADEEKRRLGN